MQSPEGSLLRHTEISRLQEAFGWRIEDHADHGGGFWTIDTDTPDSAFDDETQKAIGQVADDSWWYELRDSLIVDLVTKTGPPAALWDIGAGTGVVTAALERAGVPSIAIEPSQAGARFATARGVTSIASSLDGLDLPDGCLPAIGLFDVLEHLEEPEALLGECRRVLTPRGQIFVTVPAFPWLWSHADDVAGHQRRYTRRGLSALLSRCGFTVAYCRYGLASLTIPIALVRSLPYRFGHCPSKAALDSQLGRSSSRIVRPLYQFERHIGRRSPLGASVFAVGLVD